MVDQPSLPSPTARKPLVLIANIHEWSLRSLESVLVPNGCEVIRAYTGVAALELALSTRPEVIILDLDLPDPDGLSVCRMLRADPRVPDSTPILLTTAGPATRQQRLEVLRAGGSDLRGEPADALDAEEFVLRFKMHLRAKLDAERSRAESLLDPASGAYNARGLERRVREVASLAVRHRGRFACVAFAPDPSTTAAADLEDQLAQALQQHARTSDVVGRVGPAEFVVLAPDTDSGGAARLGERLARAVEEAVHGAAPGGIRLRAAYYALDAPPDASLDPLMPIARARAALHDAQGGRQSGT